MFDERPLRRTGSTPPAPPSAPPSDRIKTQRLGPPIQPLPPRPAATRSDEPWQSGRLAPTVRSAARPRAAAPTPAQLQRQAQQSLIERWKGRAAVGAVVAFGAFWALALGHPVGTAAQPAATGAQPAGRPAAQQPQNVPNQPIPAATQAPAQNSGGFFGGGGLFGGLGGGGGAPQLGSGGS